MSDGLPLVHLIHGDSAAGTAGMAGRQFERRLVLRDVLSTGPCHSDPAVHPVLRRMHWSRLTWFDEPENVHEHLSSVAGDILGADELLRELARLPPRAVMVFWSTPTWSNQLQLWWTLDALERGGFDIRRVRLAGLRGPSREYGLGCFRPARFRAALPRARPLTREALREGAALWRAYAAGTPEGFDAARRRGSRLFPALRACGEEFGWYFPRPCRGGRLRLCEFDEALLGQLRRDRWSHAGAVVGEFMLRTPFGQIGDSSVFQRYFDWTTCRPGENAVLLRILRRKEGYGRYSLRLTTAGERLLRRGLEVPWEAPPLWAGGTQVYGGTTWLKVARGASWKLERLS